MSRSPSEPPRGDSTPGRPTRVAIVNLLFNWPATGGRVFHTVGLGEFLCRAGYDVRHFYAVYPPWGIGRVESPVPVPSEPVVFDDRAWGRETIQDRFRRAVRAFEPDYVVVTGSWNFKPLLAEAICDYPYFLRFGALECLCPLNNVRLLPAAAGRFSQCLHHQLATPDVCHRCVAGRDRVSGSLHQRERALAGVGTMEYDRKLRPARCSGSDGATSGWSPRVSRPARSTSSLATSAGCRRRSFHATCARPTWSPSPRSPRRRWGEPPSRPWPPVARSWPAASAGCRTPSATRGCWPSPRTRSTLPARRRPCWTTPASASTWAPPAGADSKRTSPGT